MKTRSTPRFYPAISALALLFLIAFTPQLRADAADIVAPPPPPPANEFPLVVIPADTTPVHSWVDVANWFMAQPDIASREYFGAIYVEGNNMFMSKLVPGGARGGMRAALPENATYGMHSHPASESGHTGSFSLADVAAILASSKPEILFDSNSRSLFCCTVPLAQQAWQKIALDYKNITGVPLEPIDFYLNNNEEMGKLVTFFDEYRKNKVQEFEKRHNAISAESAAVNEEFARLNSKRSTTNLERERFYARQEQLKQSIESFTRDANEWNNRGRLVGSLPLTSTVMLWGAQTPSREIVVESAPDHTIRPTNYDRRN